MKSLRIRNVAGNAKLKGKKCKTLSCGCCVVTNFKEESIRKQIEKETLEEISTVAKAFNG